jgi:hypothetical protein
MTLVNLSALFETSAFYDLIGDLYDRMDEGYRDLIESKLDDKETDGKTKEGNFYNSFSKLMS